MKILTYPTLQAVYDARAAGVDMPNGDVLVIESDKVVGIMAFYPFSVTRRRGEMFDFNIDFSIKRPQDMLNLVKSIYAAIAEAQRLGYEINPDFIGFAESAPSHAS